MNSYFDRCIAIGFVPSYISFVNHQNLEMTIAVNSGVKQPNDQKTKNRRRGRI